MVLGLLRDRRSGETQSSIELMPDYLKLQIHQMPLNVNGFLVRREHGETITTAVTQDMILAHMAARVDKWMKEKPRWMRLEEAIERNMQHTKLAYIVSNDHRYWNHCMKFKNCPTCGASTMVE